MSWFKAGVAILALAHLAGCGFRPMYGEGNREALAALAAIKVEPIQDRIGQILRNNLLDRLTPFGEPARPLYRLNVEISESQRGLAIEEDDETTRFNLRISASFKLFDASTGAAIYNGSTRAVGSYNAVQSDFATLFSEQDTARRAVDVVSDEIRTQLAAFFSRRRE